MKDIKIFHKQGKKINKIFCDFMEEKGFSTWEHDDKDLGFGVIASNSNDKFIPIFELKNWHYPEAHSIFVIDRNGNSILTGEIAAIYSLNIVENWNEEEIEKRFKTMLEDIYSKYEKYSKNNRLDFSFNELIMERKNYPNLQDLYEEPYFDLLTKINTLNDSFTVARVIDGLHCVELHYNKGKAVIEYGERTDNCDWKSEIEEVDWFNKDTPEEIVSNRLWKLYDDKFYSSQNDNVMEV